jgi:alkylation response protein AidB-like acyl-CoA dehydrogenase
LRAFRIFGGTTEIQKLIIARDLLRQYQADAALCGS